MGTHPIFESDFDCLTESFKTMTNLLADTEWKVGDRCYSMFSEDELWYPATIKKVQGSVFTVEYEVYGNEEERILDELEEVEVIEGDDGNDQYGHYDRTRHLFEASKEKEKPKKEKSKKKESKSKPTKKEQHQWSTSNASNGADSAATTRCR